MLKKLFQGILIGLGCALVALALWDLGALDRFEAKTWDWRVARLARPGQATERIKLIFIDQYSLDWAKNEMGLQWPWPREVYVPILDFCKRQGARAVIFDMVFTEPSYMGVEDDEAFGTAIASNAGFVGTVFLGQDGAVASWPETIATPVPMAGLADWLSESGSRRSWLRRHVWRVTKTIDNRPRKDRRGPRRQMPTATFPIVEVAENAAYLGNVHGTPDVDAIFRRLELFTVFDNRAVPCLGLAPCFVADNNCAWQVAPGQLTIASTCLAETNSPAYHIPIDRRGRALLNYRGPSGTHQRFTAASVIQSELRLQAGEEPVLTNATAFKDCFVFLGCNAPGLLDLRPTPISRVYPGVELFATALDNTLSRDFMRDSPRGFSIMLITVLSLLAAILIRLGRNARENLLAIVLILPLPVVLGVKAYQNGYWLPILPQECAATLALVCGLLINYATEGRQKRFIRGAFKQYLSEDVIEELTRHPERLKLGGEQKTLSIFFSDLQGFTGISEGLNPQELTALLNEYLSAMTDIIQEEGGTVDKYEGDAIIAFWNAPLAQSDHATRAVRAALRCQASLAAMRPAIKERIGKDLFMRIGINTGPVVVGNMGSHNRFNYTILGDAANLASRLEGINKQFGTYTLISETTRAAIGNAFPTREIAQVAVVGRKTAVRVYELLAVEENTKRSANNATFHEGLTAFYAGNFNAAQKIFEQLQDFDPPAAAYVKKCRTLLTNPPVTWNGVWVMTEK